MKYLVMFLLAISSFVNAQNIVVYCVAGTVTLQNTGKTVALKENAIITKGSQITLKKGGSVVLFKAENAVVLKEPKMYTIENIEQLFIKNKRPTSGKYIAQLSKRANERNKNDKTLNVNRMGKIPMDGGEGINFPQDSSIILTDALALALDEEALPGNLSIFDGNKELYAINVNQRTVKMYNIGLLAEGSWYGMALTSNDNLANPSKLHVRWASPYEVAAIKKEQGIFLAEIKDLPFAVQSQLIQCYQQDKRYVALEE